MNPSPSYECMQYALARGPGVTRRDKHKARVGWRLRCRRMHHWAKHPKALLQEAVDMHFLFTCVVGLDLRGGVYAHMHGRHMAKYEVP